MTAIARWDVPSIQGQSQPDEPLPYTPSTFTAGSAHTAASPSASASPRSTGHGAGQAPPTVAHLEAIERSAYEEAFARGHAEGVAAAGQQIQTMQGEAQQQLATARRMLDTLAQPLSQLDAEVEQQLLILALRLARQLVRRELRIDPAQVIALIRETVALLPAAARDVYVHLHPLDAALVRDTLVTPDQTPAWVLIEDPVLSRGDCRINSASTQIDARLDARLQAAASALLGEERASPERGAVAAEDTALVSRGAVADSVPEMELAR